MRILIVDDNEIVLKVLGKVLTREGYEVETASACESGYEKALNGQPDLVISDYNMPDGTGIELFEKLHLSGKLPDTDFVLMSGSIEGNQKLEEVKSGFSEIKGFLRKPFTISELQAVLN